jgi:hypothetical protein
MAALARQKQREEELLSIPDEQPKAKSRGGRKVRDSQSNMDAKSQMSRSSSPLKSNLKGR